MMSNDEMLPKVKLVQIRGGGGGGGGGRVIFLMIFKSSKRYEIC